MEKAYIVDGKAFQKAMIDAGFKTISALAKASNVSRETIKALCDGTAKPSSSVIEKLSIVLGLSSEQIGAIFFRKELA